MVLGIFANLRARLALACKTCRFADLILLNAWGGVLCGYLGSKGSYRGKDCMVRHGCVVLTVVWC